MPSVPSISPATGKPTKSSYIHTLDCNFVDNAGRTLLLRGVNLSGSSKAPVNKPSYVLEDFWEQAEDGGESFVGRPLNVDDGSADIHLARLRGWGFNMLRFPVTWESLEHGGPGKYDYEFMDYTIRVLRKCKEYGFKVFLDPHQDVWSRFSGGSGAPYWTLIACGINPRNITATQAAIIHCEYPLAHDPDPASLPAMVWSTNYGRLLSQTIFTLFFAGKDFAPKCIIDGKNIQDYLQEHYIEAMGQLADRIRDTASDLLDDCVIGWDSMNEPFEGLCGWDDLNVNPTAQGSTLKKGTYPTPAQSFRLGMGQAQTVEHWTFGMFGPRRNGSVSIDPKGLKIWAEPDIEDAEGVHPKWGWRRSKEWQLGTCIWAQHGVWDIETGFVMAPDYFRYIPQGHLSPDNLAPLVEFVADYWRPHWNIFCQRLRRAHPEAIMFIEPPVFAPPPPLDEAIVKGRCCYSPHYYDGLTLITRHWNWFNADALGVLRGKYSSPIQAVKFGESAIRKSLQEQLSVFLEDVRIIGQYPTIIGEIGTPFDMDGKRSYGWTDGGKYQGDYSRQERALDASLNGADGTNAINYTIWTYCPDSCHDWGDGWNMEDLSLWSEDDLGVTGGGTLRRSLYSNDKNISSATMYGAGGDGSQAVLLKKKNMIAPSKRPAAAASSFSLTTLNGPGIADMLSGWQENPYDFLTDGARAVKAFSRPYPVKVIGRPQEIAFDIGKAHFKLMVNVRPEDRLKPGGVSEDDPATEIFIPLVHFAHSRLLPTSPDARHEAGGKENILDGPDGLSSEPLSRMESRNASTINIEDTSMYPDGSNNNVKSSSSYNSASSTPTMTLATLKWHGVTSEKDLLDIDVSVSGGRWSVHGQVLKWWYDVPAAGEPERTYTIEVKRTGGAIKTQEEQACSWVERLCPADEDCRIM
ncbi:glycoside hydrolase family 5 protein [Moniliophthora roreri MCA 2997]|uniref:Glycoside hydrolase family 5 protein n=1 Tax=Moniliophthora roreri (strain MCA 2997) TaxID=1381753 RepID=V2WZK0_MONRO|nr:glycoside hydrolase family 5 protein [Moniliophthora roreri MCA 2997]